ncbi:MAG TPA: hypothetical protein VMV05_01420 [bacterium]|nr:hypothetical protein [bacterium]
MPSQASSNSVFQADLDKFSASRKILRSWFWRFYDHLAQIILYNMGWFLTCCIPAWLGWKARLVLNSEGMKYFGVYFLFLFECLVSVGWAYLTFKIFMGESTTLKDLWVGYRSYYLKAVGISAVSGIIILLAVFNIRFYLSGNHQHSFTEFLLAGFVFWILLFWVANAFYQWPLLFFQDPPFFKIFYKSLLIVLANALSTFWLLLFLSFFSFFFTVLPFLWFVIGLAFFFSILCVALEKHLLKYKIIYGNQPLAAFVERLNFEQKRGWRDFLRPWENG